MGLSKNSQIGKKERFLSPFLIVIFGREGEREKIANHEGVGGGAPKILVTARPTSNPHISLSHAGWKEGGGRRLV